MPVSQTHNSLTAAKSLDQGRSGSFQECQILDKIKENFLLSTNKFEETHCVFFVNIVLKI